MKKSFLIAAVLLAATVSCQKEQLQETDGHGKFRIRATREANIDTKATITDDGVFGWSEGDAFGLYANGKFYPFTTTGSGESAVFEGNYLGTLGSYAVFPNNLSPAVSATDGKVSVTLPDTYEWKEGIINTPMLASFDAGSGLPAGIIFNHLGGLIRVTLNNIPKDATSFVFSTTNNMPITGTFTAEKESEADDSKMQIKSTETSGTSANSVKFTFSASESATSKSFYVPVPVGKYTINFA